MKSSNPPSPNPSKVLARLSPERRQLLERRLRNSSAKITPRSDKEAPPLSFAQQQLWFLDRLYPDSIIYNVTRSFRLTGVLKEKILQQVFDTLVQRHETLRTSFATAHGQTVQIIAPEMEFPVPMIELDAGTEQQIDEQIYQYMEKAEKTPFDLEQGPLIRATLLRIDPGQHVLVLVIHHIITDGLSLNLIMDELATLYASYSNGQASPMAPLSVHYADYAVWQHQQMQAGKFEKHITYWRSKLENSSMLELPTNRPNPPEPDFRAATRTLKLPVALGEKLKNLGQSASVSLFMIFLGAFQTLLHRYREQEDIVIATPIAGRTRPELDDLLGYFVNTLVLRTNFGGNPTFIELLGRVRETALGAFAHQDLAFSKLVEKLQVERHTARNPYFNVMINFREGLDQWADFAGLSVRQEKPRVTACAFPLTLYISPYKHGIKLRMDFQTALFDAGQVDCMLRQFAYLLEQISADPDRPIRSYSLIDYESRKLLPDPTRALEVPTQPTITAMFADSVTQSPERHAISQGEQNWTYAELNRTSDLVAQLLHRQNIDKGDVVAVTGERNFGLISAMLGILKGSGVMLPIDPNLPVKRRASMLEIAQTRVQIVVGDAQEEGQAAMSNIPVLKLEANTGLPTIGTSIHSDEWADLPAPQPDDPAYIFFTSGSTGTPKGILGSHKGLGHYISWVKNQFDISMDDRVAQLASISFDSALFDIFLPLASTGVLCLPLEKEEAELVRWLQRQAITIMGVAPSVARSWLLDVPDDVSFPALRILSFGGEALSNTVVEEWRARVPDSCTIVNQYGPTETTVASCFHIVGEQISSGIQPIGQALPQTQSLILNRDGALAGIGEKGEIVIRSPFNTLGYLVASKEADSGFRTNPFLDDAQEIIYYTGDMGCYRPDGTLDFLGRLDDQVKIHGVRMELEEIRIVLVRHPGVKEATILVREDRAGDKHLVAYIILEQTGPPTSRVLRRALAEHLPKAMIPGIFMPLDALPLTHSGKLDRKALPIPDLNRSMSGNEYVLPRTRIEKTLVKLWQEALSLDAPPGIHDDFFALGGHSLLALQMVTQIEKKLKQALPLQYFYIHPTIAEVAGELEQSWPLSTQQQQKQGVIALSQPERKDAPLSFAQQRLWFLDCLFPNTSLYNISLVLRLTGTLNLEALQRAFNTLVQRHETLRTSFAAPQGIPVQIISSEMDLPLPVINLDIEAGRQMQEQIEQYAREAAETTFDLLEGPLINIKLLRLDSVQHVLILVIHHIITDGISMDLMMQELETLYSAYARGKASPLTPLPIQYVDYAAWQHQQMQSGELDKHLAYWRTQLDDAPMLELPIDRPYPFEQNFQGARCSLNLSAGLNEKLAALSRATGVSLFMTFLGAFQVLLHRYRGQEDIVIATPIAGRTRPEHAGQLGFFVNTLILRTDLSANPTFIELLGRVREMALGAYAHQDLPFEKLVENLQPERDIGRTPFFNVMINFHEERGHNNTSFSDLTMHREVTSPTSSKFPLELYVSTSREGIQVRMTYQTDIFDAGHIDCLLRQYSYLLEQIAVAPDQPIQSYSLVDTESRKLLPSPTQALDEPAQQVVTETFSSCARQHPDREAISHGERSWTYVELDRASDLAAQLLHHQGIKTGEVVAVTGERSFGLITAMLGILKNGNVMLPIDRVLPAKRRATMLQVAQAQLQITVGDAVDENNMAGIDTPDLKLDANTGLATLEPSAQRENWVDLPAPLPDDPAYIFFTSGSTGQPKGILGSHKGLGHLISWQRKQFNIGIDDRVTQLTHLSFDLFLIDVFLPLTSAATLCIPLQEDESEIFLWLQRQAITTLSAVPSVAQSWLADAPAKASLPALRFLSFGGEALMDTVVKDWRARVPDSCTIVNMYGPTETTVTRCFYIVDEPARPGIQPIGQALPQTQSLILNKVGTLAGVGEAGEIVIRSPFNTLGYLANTEEASSGFRANPFQDGVQEIIYYTGDKGCYRPDGTLNFLGRLDDQVKIRGVRIELEEIRIVLNRHPKIDQAAVLVRKDHTGVKRLVAYIVLLDTSLPTTESLRRALAEHLPNTMIPEIFMPIEAMPLTPSGKLNLKALPVPELDRSILGSTYMAPGSEVEETLTNIWQEVLMLDSPPGIHDDFFALGGHSLLSAHLVARIEDTLGQAMPLQYFFTHPTIAELAKELEKTEEPFRAESPQSTFHATGPWQLVPGLYDKLLSYVGSWRGERATPNSLAIGHNTSGSRPPLFWVLQSQYELSQLAAYLDDDQPLYGMRSGSAMMSYEELNIQTLALGYVEEIIALRPAGPLLLGGNCQGGIIALAIAQHLLRRQREVPTLILMEWTYPPQPYGGPVTLLFGRDSHSNPYTQFRYPELAWERAFSDYCVEIISGVHSQFFNEPNIQDLVTKLEHHISRALETPPRLLPETAKQVKLRVINPPETLPAGGHYILQVEVQNASTVAWDRGEITGLMLGNEWHSPEGKTVSLLDGRVPLPPLLPGETTRIELPVVAPSQCGQIGLLIELMEEGVRQYEGETGSIQLALDLVEKI